MKFKLVRDTFTDRSTIGKLYADDKYLCYTLEDLRRGDGVKVKHETCIPPGVYQVIVTYSNRFQKNLPLLVDVPGFDGIRIHSGNDAADTSGCVLVGQTKGVDVIGQSRAAFAPVLALIEGALRRGETVELEIMEKR